MHTLTLLSRRLRGLLGSRRDCPTLGETDLLVIWVCASDRADGVSQSQLAAGLGVSAAQISALVERLRQAGLIVGRRDGADRRRQLWQLTAAGRSAWETALAEVQRAVEPLAARLGRSRGEHLRRALTALVAELDAAARCAASAACAAGEDPAREAA